MQDKLYIGTNTKMYKTISQTASFLKTLGELTRDIDRNLLELFVIPSFTALKTCIDIARDAGIALGAQNMCWEDEGQYTGEISPLMLQEIGVEVIEIGHSERRHVFGETDEMENWKVGAALRNGFTPLLCVGETEKQKEYNVSNDILRTQLKMGLWKVTPEQAENIWIAYEPVWAIGVTGRPASPEYIEEKHTVIRQTLVQLFGSSSGGRIPILYGGSVNNENASSLIRMPHVDGLFIGRSAWDAQNFSKIIHNILPLFMDRDSA